MGKVDADASERGIVCVVNRTVAAGILGVEPHVLEQLATKSLVSVAKGGYGGEIWGPEHVARAFCIIAEASGYASRKDYGSAARRINQIFINKAGNKFKSFFKTEEWHEVMKRADLQGLSFEGSIYDIED